MSLDTGLIDYIKSIFISQFKILVDRRIMRSTHCIEIKLLEYLHILADGSLVHRMSQLRMLHMSTLSVDLYRLSVKIEYAVDYLSLLEADPLYHFINDLARIVLERHLKIVKVRGFRCPFLRCGNSGPEVNLSAATLGNRNLLIH